MHGTPIAATAEEEVKKLEESPEPVPAKETLEEGAQHTEAVSQEAIKASTETAIHDSNLKVDHPRPVDLPKEKVVSKEKVREEEPKEEAHDKTTGHFSIQLGSYPSKKEAQLKIGSLQKRGLKAEIMTAVVKGETRYRVVIPGFKTKVLAEARGHELHAKRKVESFVVIKAD